MRGLFNRFNTKVLGMALLVVVGSQAATVLAVLSYAENEIEQRADRELSKAKTTFAETMQHRADALAGSIASLAAEDGFKRAVASGNKKVVAASLQARAARSGADVAMLLAIDGTVIASSNTDQISASKYPQLVDNPRQTIMTDEVSYEMVSVPVRAPNTIGYVSLGYRISDDLATRLARSTGVEMSILRSQESGSISVLASSLATYERNLLLTATRQLADKVPFEQATAQLGRYFQSGLTEYMAGDKRILVVFHKRLEEAREPFVALRGAMLHAASVSLLGTLALAFILSRAVTNPMRQLLLAARRMSVGNYSKQLEIHSNDEFGELALAFESMREGIAEREQRIVYQAEFDALTGLPNRIQAMDLLQKTLADATETGDPVVVMIMHLQRFREIQSSLGHEIGDEVLRQTAQRMRAALKDSQILARLEGDQFLIVGPDMDKEDGKRLARLLAGILDAGLDVQSVNVTLDACIGFCVSPEHGRQPDELMRRAAVAKSDAQQSQKRIRIYQNGREARHVRQLAILGDMRRATRENELELYLQPKIALSNTQVCGAEALLRWNHPELGQIPPIEFIPLAERAGCIGMITQWMLSRAVAQCRHWRDQGIYLPIAVNLSAQDLLNDNLIPIIEQELDKNGMDASCLICEITEEAVVHDLEHAIRVLDRLREMGARASMDDFGTGYSSLGHLQKLPVDEIKIDRAFVMQLPDHPQNTAIVRAIIDLAHNLDLEVVAEGVETTAALRWLREQGCERAQGYYLSKPMPADDFIGWIHNWENLARHDIATDANMTDSLILRPRLIT